jgi:hypothetical protein
MSLPREITKKLQGADPELSRYVKELVKENSRLHDKVAKLQAKNTSKDNEIKALKKLQPPGVKIIIQGLPDQGQNTPSIPPSLPEAPPYQHPEPIIPGEPIQITK